MNKVELLAPAGSFDAFLVAIASGADAVYISGKSFGARAFAPNFTNEELKEAVRYAHILKKKVYVTINTLIYNHELNELSDYIDYLYTIKVDALIVQDLGVVNLIKKLHPNFIIHASTQMSIYNEVGIKNLQKIGIKRAILAREVSIDKIKELVKLGTEIEIFVHGALCYAYSGNCLMSYAIGKRSGNRGACAQPCRKKYTLLENNKALIKNKSMLSMKDLSVINNLDLILDAGVSSLKIEGRMKSLEYVQTIVSLYRKKIDEYYLNSFDHISLEEEKKVKVTFNRGFTKGYLLNDNNINRTDYNNVNHQGITIGKVITKNNKKITIKLTEDLSFNDGIRFKGQNEVGAYVNEMYLNNKLVKFAPKNSNVTLVLNTPCNVGDIVYKTVDMALQSQAKDLVKNFPLKRDVTINVNVALNKPLQMEMICDEFKISCESSFLCEKANNPLSIERICSQVSKLHDTLFKAEKINVNYDGLAFFIIKDLNELRRVVVSKMEELLIDQVERCESGKMLVLSEYIDNLDVSLDVVVSNKEQYQYCKNLGINNLYYDDNYSDRFQSDLNEKGIIHNLGQFIDGSSKYIPSIYMNILNNESLEMLNKLGFTNTYLSSELSIEDSKSLNKNLLHLGYFIYGKEDLMVSNQCFIASSLGYDHKKCFACLKNKYELIDEFGNAFPVLTDVNNCDVRILNFETRNEIFNIKRLINYGIKRLLVIFTIETKEEIEKIINLVNREINR